MDNMDIYFGLAGKNKCGGGLRIDKKSWESLV